MQDVHDQHEVEAFKAWWKENGMSVLTGVAIAIAGVLGWQGYQDYQRSNNEAASAVYESLRVAQSQNKFTEVSRDARQLMVDHAASPYAVGAAFMLAKSEADKEDWAGAQSDLQWVIDHSKDVQWKAIAQLRLARVMIENKQPAQAISLLNTASTSLPTAFKGMADYVRGMALLQQGDQQAAQQAFSAAQANNELSASIRSLSQLWVDDLTQAKP